MNLEKYSVETDLNYMVFEFVSVGAKGRVVKIVHCKAIVYDAYLLRRKII
jgi:hypothetical protein